MAFSYLLLLGGGKIKRQSGTGFLLRQYSDLDFPPICRVIFDDNELRVSVDNILQTISLDASPILGVSPDGDLTALTIDKSAASVILTANNTGVEVDEPCPTL